MIGGTMTRNSIRLSIMLLIFQEITTTKGTTNHKERVISSILIHIKRISRRILSMINMELSIRILTIIGSKIRKIILQIQ